MSSRGITAKRYQMYVADFETSDAWVSQGSYDVPDQRVWLAGVKNLETMQTKTFTSLDDFMTDILSRKTNVNREYGFHNLKFDGSFIIPWLLRHGYQVTHKIPKRGEFSVLIDDLNNWYSIQIQETAKRRITLWDTLKLFPTKLEYVPNIYATPTQKIKESEAFYSRVRLKGYEPNEHEYKYLENDLTVLAEALRAHIDLYGLRFKKTQASQAFDNFEQTFNAWRLRFPPLDVDIDTAIRPAYWGGMSYVNPRYQGKDLFNVAVFDINSSYPYQMAYKPLPYGPVQDITQGTHPNMSKFWVADCLLYFKKKPGKLPCIPKKALIEQRPLFSDLWLDGSNGLVRMKFCSIDYVNMLECYDIEIVEWRTVWHWSQKVHLEVQDYILKNNADKIKYRQLAREAKDPAKVSEYLAKCQRAKINNNAFYGKFGESIIKEGKTPYLVGGQANDDGKPLYIVGGDVHYIMDREDITRLNKRKYLPVAMACTAYGRQQLLAFANHVSDAFVYCDTDSVHVLVDALDDDYAPPGAIFDPVKLGAWDYEGIYDRARFLRSKCYYEQVNGQSAEVTLAGLPADPHSGPRSKKRSAITWDNFHIGLLIPADKSNKLASKRTPTGVKLIPVEFQITERETFTWA